MFGQIKVSMHESGHCQLGPTPRLRDRISWRFRPAAEAWQYDRHTVTDTPAFAIVFRGDQLVAPEHPPHPDSVRMDLGDDQELWVLFLIQPAHAAPVDYQPFQLFYELQLGDGTALHVILHRQNSEPRWLEAIANFEVSQVAEYPMSLSGDTYAYVMAEREGIDHIALEVAGPFLEEQSWASVEAVHTDRKTTEEHAMEHLITVITKLEGIRKELKERGPVWDGRELDGLAEELATALTSGLGALACFALIAQADGATIGSDTQGDEELRFWLSLTEAHASPCTDPDCPGHIV